MCQALCWVLWEGISVTLLSLVSLPRSPSLRKFLAFSTLALPYRLAALVRARSRVGSLEFSVFWEGLEALPGAQRVASSCGTSAGDPPLANMTPPTLPCPPPHCSRPLTHPPQGKASGLCCCPPKPWPFLLSYSRPIGHLDWKWSKRGRKGKEEQEEISTSGSY